ncbi:hypothetical protein Ga0061064_1955 [Pseudidiomarina woesei]|uniref:Uncharacterized protein n=1 Tax=Pseudidiomarina woesei TaxID=1381080 RepID=A0A0K6HAE5_9GAMM|nr:hypothetical protein Ga0061064_1955 [Pseudidiomarina woesei]
MSGGGSSYSMLVLFSVVYLMLVVLSYVKNRMPTTLRSDHGPERGDYTAIETSTEVLVDA